jgi:cysteinyl-tRNA synthetase
MATSVLDLIGNTPLVRIGRLHSRPGVEVLAKLESFNPGGSVKDRVALAMVRAAEQSGELTPQKTIIEATSGNTGIGLAMVCAVKGYRLMLLMPESASEERKRIMAAFGADIYLTPGHLQTDGAIEEAYRLAREHPDTYVLMDQFNNPAGVRAHYLGTAREIWEQTGGRVTHVVASLGTSGTAMGLASGLRELDPSIRVVAVEPYAGHKIQGLKNMQASYPPGIYNKHALDRIIRIPDERAFALCRALAAQEGIFAGMSSGAAMGGALQLAEELQEGTIVVVLPDGGERYLSTSLFVPPSRQGLSLYNIPARDQEVLATESQPLALFVPGPSPDTPGDPEAWRRVVFSDVLAKYLDFKNVDVHCAVGVADLDDRALERARERGQSSADFSADFTGRLRELGSRLGLDARTAFHPASSQVPSMLEACRQLLNKGRAYEKLRSVYYDVFRDRDYGGLVGADLDKLDLGKTVDLEDYAKDNPKDFTLLKRASLRDLKSGEFVKTEWGNVRPSWYLQMAMAPGDWADRVRVVLAGRTHQFPHLENLRAIWTKGGRSEPQIWMVVQAVTAREERVPDLGELLQEAADPGAVRMWLLSVSYRKPLVYSRENLRMWQNNWRRVQNLAADLRVVRSEQGRVGKTVDQALFDLKTGFTEAMEDDLGVYRFWPVLFDSCKTLHQRFDRGELSGAEAEAALKELARIDRVLGIIDWERLPLPAERWPEDLARLVEARRRAREHRDFGEADRLRERIREAGYHLEDTPYGPRVYRG